MRRSRRSFARRDEAAGGQASSGDRRAYSANKVDDGVTLRVISDVIWSEVPSSARFFPSRNSSHVPLLTLASMPTAYLKTRLVIVTSDFFAVLPSIRVFHLPLSSLLP